MNHPVDNVSENRAEVLFHNARILTMNPALPRATVLAVKGQEIAYAGDSLQEAAACLAPGARRVDLDGKTVIPGLIESHMHFLGEGQRLSEVDMFMKPKEEILRLVADEAQKSEPGQWITGRGWNNEIWPDKSWPGKRELDAAAPHNPVALTRMDGHSMWVNSLALQAAHITADTPNPQGGEIFRLPDGEPQGILVDTPIFKIWARLPAPTDAQALAAYHRAEKELFVCGITSLVNAHQTLQQHNVLARAYEAGELKIRVYELFGAQTGQDTAFLEQEHKPFTGRFGERLTAGGVKLIGDGSLGSRSAWMLEDYADRPGHRGNGRYSDEEMHAVIKRAGDTGLQACVHAIGDASVRQAVRVIGRVLDEKLLPDHRFRIEHFQTAASEDIATALRLGVIASMQTIHEPSDRNMVSSRLSPTALARSYPWREVLDGGGIIANGSDAPMEKVNPFLGMHAAISRPDPARNMTRLEALLSYTVWGAYAEFSEKRKGSLEPGKLADFAVLDRNVLTCPAAEIPKTRVLLTVTGGEIVHTQSA